MESPPGLKSANLLHILAFEPQSYPRSCRRPAFGFCALHCGRRLRRGCQGRERAGGYDRGFVDVRCDSLVGFEDGLTGELSGGFGHVGEVGDGHLGVGHGCVCESVMVMAAGGEGSVLVDR